MILKLSRKYWDEFSLKDMFENIDNFLDSLKNWSDKIHYDSFWSSKIYDDRPWSGEIPDDGFWSGEVHDNCFDPIIHQHIRSISPMIRSTLDNLMLIRWEISGSPEQWYRV